MSAEVDHDGGERPGQQRALGLQLSGASNVASLPAAFAAATRSWLGPEPDAEPPRQQRPEQLRPRPGRRRCRRRPACGTGRRRSAATTPKARPSSMKVPSAPTASSPSGSLRKTALPSRRTAARGAPATATAAPAPPRRPRPRRRTAAVPDSRPHGAARRRVRSRCHTPWSACSGTERRRGGGSAPPGPSGHAVHGATPPGTVRVRGGRIGCGGVGAVTPPSCQAGPCAASVD